MIEDKPITIYWLNGFAPTPRQHPTYKAIMADYDRQFKEWAAAQKKRAWWERTVGR